MRIDALLSTIILVSFLVTILMAVGSYAAYKLRERRRPHAEPRASGEESPYFERIFADES
jgi:heme/copper-type cytochrome/quinol oxidase subunit 2